MQNLKCVKPPIRPNGNGNQKPRAIGFEIAQKYKII